MSAPIPMRHESMRIAGRKVDTVGRVPVHYPYTGAQIGSVPAGTAEHAAEAFAIAAAYQPTLTRYERQKILLNVARIISDRKAELAPIITAELGISPAIAVVGLLARAAGPSNRSAARLARMILGGSAARLARTLMGKPLDAKLDAAALAIGL